ncbi:MAG: phospholipase D-like domain-containing protein [Pseudomonadota bacterium]
MVSGSDHSRRGAADKELEDAYRQNGLGNLIALPLQKAAREHGHSVFLDENFEPYEDQWGFLANIGKLSAEEMAGLIPRLSPGNELGALRKDDEDAEKPWEKERIRWSGNDFPQEVRLVKANMLYIEKAGISQRGLNALKRLAAFRNPEFYKAQALRLPTYDKPRIISCSEETSAYLCLPRGCETDVAGLLDEAGVRAMWLDHTCPGRRINVAFNGNLREEQIPAAEEMLKHDIGVLSATTAFGKTVIAAKLIAERKANTLILTHRRQLLSQWTAKLEEEGKEPSIQRLYAAIAVNEPRNERIAEDVLRCFQNGGNALVLTERTAHVALLAGYASIGYKARAESVPGESTGIIFNNTTFLPVYKNDLLNAAREILIVSPFVTKRRVSQMLPFLGAAQDRKVKAVVVTRPAANFREKDRPSLEEALALLIATGIQVAFKSNIHQKFAVFDQKIVWYGSVNLLSFGRAEESIMRLENPSIADELLGSIQK